MPARPCNQAAAAAAAAALPSQQALQSPGTPSKQRPAHPRLPGGLFGGELVVAHHAVHVLQRLRPLRLAAGAAGRVQAGRCGGCGCARHTPVRMQGRRHAAPRPDRLPRQHTWAGGAGDAGQRRASRPACTASQWGKQRMQARLTARAQSLQAWGTRAAAGTRPRRSCLRQAGKGRVTTSVHALAVPQRPATAGRQEACTNHMPAAQGMHGCGPAAHPLASARPLDRC